MTIYEQMIKNQVPVGNHESDLYAKVTPMSTLIINEYEHRQNVKTFKNNVDKTLWYDIPFAFDPFWKGKSKNNG